MQQEKLRIDKDLAEIDNQQVSQEKIVLPQSLGK